MVTVYDPLQGERNLPRSTFDTAWAMMHNERDFGAIMILPIALHRMIS